MDFSNQMFFSANAKKGTKPLPPIKIPRPGREEPKRRAATSQEMRRFFGRRKIYYSGD